MRLGLVGKKCGMTRIFTESGESIPVTVVEVQPNRITQIKTEDNDGYRAVQVTTGQKRNSRVSKGLAGHFAKAGVEAGNVIREFRLREDQLPDAKMADLLKVDMFTEGQKVDISGVTIGKGFAGGVKRHHFRTQDATHGSIGQNQTPGRVFKGKKMAGHLGNVNRTAQNQEVIRIDLDRNLILIKGALPGAPGGVVVITPSIKQKGGVV
jgi:large subunit ribosomal protein L3